MKTIIHVNQHVIKANAKNGTIDPVLTVKTYKSNIYAHSVEILGPSRVVYSPDKPLSCGAKVWIETESDVLVDQQKILWEDEEILEEAWKASNSKFVSGNERFLLEFANRLLGRFS